MKYKALWSIMLTMSLTLICGCSLRARSVCFLVPEGFRGTFEIRKSRTDGIALLRRGDTIYYDLTTTNVLVTKDTRPLERFNALMARYPSGVTIYGLAQSGTHPEKFVVRVLFATSKGGYFYYVGPENELDQAEKEARSASRAK